MDTGGMSMGAATELSDSAVIGRIFEVVALDLGAVLGRALPLSGQEVTRATSRPAGKRLIHISFRLALSKTGRPTRYGSVLVPLPDAIAAASLLLMAPDEDVAARRTLTTLDPALKDALLEIGNIIGGAGNAALGSLGVVGCSLHSVGCQGVRADVPPTFPYEQGSELVVARATTRFEPYPPFELILMLPPVS